MIDCKLILRDFTPENQKSQTMSQNDHLKQRHSKQQQAHQSGYYGGQRGVVSLLWYKFLELTEQVQLLRTDASTTNFLLLLITIAIYVALAVYISRVLYS